MSDFPVYSIASSRHLEPDQSDWVHNRDPNQWPQAPTIRADREQFLDDYIPTAVETIDAHGGRVLVGAPNPEMLEGE